MFKLYEKVKIKNDEKLNGLVGTILGKASFPEEVQITSLVMRDYYIVLIDTYEASFSKQNAAFILRSDKLESYSLDWVYAGG